MRGVVIDIETERSLRMVAAAGPLCVHGAVLSADGTAVVLDVPQGTEFTPGAAIALGNALVHLGELAKGAER